METCYEEGSPLRHDGCNGEKLGRFANPDEVSLPYVYSPPWDIAICSRRTWSQDYMAVPSGGLTEQASNLGIKSTRKLL